jgi:membrane protein involved in colicin uptake
MEMENMRQMIKQMMTRLEEAEAKAEARQEGADARQEKANAEMKASQERARAEMKVVKAEIKAAYAKMEAGAEARHERFLVFLDGWTSYGKGTTTYRSETTSSSGEMKGATKMEINPDETEAPVERQDLFKEEINVDNIGPSVDRCEEQAWLCDVA